MNKLFFPSRRSALRILASTPFLAMPIDDALSQTGRKWTVTGKRAPRFDALDAVMQRAMQAGNIRAGALALACKGRILFERGYTWAEPDYPVTQPDSLFRTASLDKMLICALVYELVKTRAITLETRVFPYLALDPFPRPGRAVDPRLNDITVHQLIDHKGGLAREWYSGKFGCCGPALRAIAHELSLHRAPTFEEVVRYMMSEPLQSDPGTKENYSNLGYGLLHLVCEKAAKMNDITAVRKYVTGPLKVEVFAGSTDKEKRLPREVFYDDPGSGPAVDNPDRDDVVPSAYGADFYAWKEVSLFVASAPALARFAGHYAVYGLGGRSSNYYRAGSLPGNFGAVTSLANGLDLCVLFNTRAFDNTVMAIVAPFSGDKQGLHQLVSQQPSCN